MRKSVKSINKDNINGKLKAKLSIARTNIFTFFSFDFISFLIEKSAVAIRSPLNKLNKNKMNLSRNEKYK